MASEPVHSANMALGKQQMGPILLGPSRLFERLTWALYFALMTLILISALSMVLWVQIAAALFCALLLYRRWQQVHDNRTTGYQRLQLNRQGALWLDQRRYQLERIQGYSRYLMICQLRTQTGEGQRLLICCDGLYDLDQQPLGHSAYRDWLSLSLLAISQGQSFKS
ncbi:hypothetical protein VST7929_00468 [Vibrio stylophorae]|uniref:DUF2244 domain-containing protein n=1 Tax=Vibrio stylophorae TaxID=659351 RepID=A0ABN8DQ81_9VIBR|nr:protein YgfX [Vibrio stylophorae]CAH0532628.1 hypothetical protein VST7929_00468 [Vibrio stylophorae]